MIPIDYMLDIKGRLDAARDYIQDFKVESERFFNNKPYEITCDQEFKDTIKIVRYRFVIVQKIPKRLHLSITACIGQLRPVLDNLVFGLSQITGENFSCSIDFPICIDESSSKTRAWCFNKWVMDNQGVLAKFPEGAVNLIRKLQPFNPDIQGNRGVNHVLYVLNKLANQDKHKFPIHVTGINHNHGATVQGPIAVTATSEEEAIPLIIQTGPLKPNSVVVQLPLPKNQSVNHIEPQITTYIAFDKEGSAAGIPVYEFLVNTYTFIRDEVINKFEPFFY